jgi:hypothetical protein
MIYYVNPIIMPAIFIATVVAALMTDIYHSAMSSYEKYTVSIQLITAVLLLATVIIALFNAKIMRYMNRPYLKLTIDDAGGILNGEERFYHVRLVNERKKAPPAHDMRIMLVEIQIKRNAEGVWERVRLSAQHQLKWQHEEKARLSRYRNCGDDLIADLISIKSNINENNCCLKLHIHDENESSRKILNELRIFRVLLQARGESYDSRNRLAIEILWNGKWESNDDSMRSCLKMNQITEKKFMTCS